MDGSGRSIGDRAFPDFDLNRICITFERAEIYGPGQKTGKHTFPLLLTPNRIFLHAVELAEIYGSGQTNRKTHFSCFVTRAVYLSRSLSDTQEYKKTFLSSEGGCDVMRFNPEAHSDPTSLDRSSLSSHLQ